MFFQAEDGIRDGHVTGVQTCALPICPIGTEMPATSILVSMSARAGMKRPSRRPAIIASPIQTGSHLSNVDNCRVAAAAGAGVLVVCGGAGIVLLSLLVSSVGGFGGADDRGVHPVRGLVGELHARTREPRLGEAVEVLGLGEGRSEERRGGNGL